MNPGGIRNQIEDGIIQSLSWTTREEMTFSATHRTGFDWSAHPIMRFEDVPDSIDVHIVDRHSQLLAFLEKRFRRNHRKKLT